MLHQPSISLRRQPRPFLGRQRIGESKGDECRARLRPMRKIASPRHERVGERRIEARCFQSRKKNYRTCGIHGLSIANRQVLCQSERSRACRCLDHGPACGDEGVPAPTFRSSTVPTFRSSLAARSALTGRGDALVPTYAVRLKTSEARRRRSAHRTQRRRSRTSATWTRSPTCGDEGVPAPTFRSSAVPTFRSSAVPTFSWASLPETPRRG